MNDIFPRLSQDLHIPGKIVEERCAFFKDVIKPKIRTKFLSHLVTTVEDLMNLPAASGGVSCKRCIVYEVRSVRKLLTVGVYYHFFC
jgi:hypothetical protein